MSRATGRVLHLHWPDCQFTSLLGPQRDAATCKMTDLSWGSRQTGCAGFGSAQGWPLHSCPSSIVFLCQLFAFLQPTHLRGVQKLSVSEIHMVHKSYSITSQRPVNQRLNKSTSRSKFISHFVSSKTSHCFKGFQCPCPSPPAPSPPPPPPPPSSFPRTLPKDSKLVRQYFKTSSKRCWFPQSDRQVGVKWCG